MADSLDWVDSKMSGRPNWLEFTNILWVRRELNRKITLKSTKLPSPSNYLSDYWCVRKLQETGESLSERVFSVHTEFMPVPTSQTRKSHDSQGITLNMQKKKAEYYSSPAYTTPAPPSHPISLKARHTKIKLFSSNLRAFQSNLKTIDRDF